MKDKCLENVVEQRIELADESDIETDAGLGLGWTSPDCWNRTTVIRKAVCMEKKAQKIMSVNLQFD